MPQNIKFKWDAFNDADHLELGIMLDGNPVGDLNLPGNATEQEYQAYEEPYTRYAANVRMVGPVIPCTVELVGEG